MIAALGVLFVAVPIARASTQGASSPEAAAPTTGTISGTVTDTNGVPIPGVLVQGAYGTGTTTPVTTAPPTTVSVPGTTPYVPPTPLSATTDLQGRYRIEGVSPGSQSISFMPPSTAPFAAQSYTGGAPAGAYASVNVVAGRDTTGIDGALPPGGTIAGVVTNMAGVPMPTVSVCLLQQNPGNNYYYSCTNPDATGQYRFSNWPTGTYKVQFQNQTSQPPQYPSEYFDDTTDQAAATVLNLGPGQVIAGVNARLDLSCSVFGSNCAKITSGGGCLTAQYLSTRKARLSSCTAATSTQWTDTAGHNTVGNPVTLDYAGDGPFTVTASSSSGGSVFKETIVIQFATPVTAPGAPTLVTATPRDGAVVVAWAAPKSDGNTPITGYDVTASVGGKTCSWTTGPRSCTITGLANGTPVSFSVKAKNAVGSGPASPGVSGTPVATPAPPASITAFAGDGSVLVTWPASPSNGGSALTGYVALASPGGQTCAAAAGRACTIQGLPNGVATTVTVRAVNGVGVGAPSPASAAVTPLGRPTAPLHVVGQAGNGEVAVAWSAPERNGGSPILGYKVTTVPGGATCSAAVTTCTVAGLTNGVPYTFSVIATTLAGDSPTSEASAPVIPGTPSEPLTVTATAGKLSATVAWAAPASAGLSAVTGYTVVGTPYGPGCTTTQLTCSISGLTEGTSYTFRVYAQNALGSGPPSAESNSVTPWAGSGYHPVVPSRILDSRTNTGWSGPLAAGAPRTLKVTDLGGGSSVPSTATAVVMNVTATGSTAGSFITVWPAGTTQPNASNLNFAAGQTIPNLVTVKIGAGGGVVFGNAAGQVGVIGDVVGYYDDGTGPGDLFTPIDPVRVLDSRTPTGGWNGKLAAGSPRDLAVRKPQNGNGVPASATAVIANVTVTGATVGSFVSVWPAGVPKPSASNLNFGPGQTISNLAIVQIGSNGALSFDNAAGAVDVIVDVVGYFDPSAGSRFHALSPVRFLDSRTGTGTYGPWQPGEQRTVSTSNGSSGSGGTGTGIPQNATGLVANITATAGTAGSYVTVFPGNGTRPNTSNLAFGAGQTIPNLVTVKTGPYASIAIYNNQGVVQLIGDAVGYYATT